MEDFGGSTGLRFHRRFRTKGQRDSFSPSYGVRHGFISNPNWPPPPNTDEGPDRRAHPRVPMRFEIALGQGPSRFEVSGNISAGGAMFLLGQPLKSKQVDVFVPVPASNQPAHLVGEVLAVEVDTPGKVAHRVRWKDPALFQATADVIVAWHKRNEVLSASL